MRRLLVLLVLCLFAGCGEPPLPAIELVPLNDLAKVVRWSDFKGKTVLLDFWATWCGPCRAAMPQVQAVWEKYRAKGLEVVAITDEDEQTVHAFHAGSPYNYPVYLDRGDTVQNAFKVDALPTFVLVRDGQVLWRQSGFAAGDNSLVEAVTDAMG